ncbi:tail fiber/spike domain-containing protein [Serratia quinivorans]|uniref:tail fiber/spike domain-containing protein n=1 Tax=Serratia quinivorans TaxID=137545 RepID=UPI003982AFDD
MATTPTNNKIPSESLLDLKFNSGKIDEFVTSMGWTYTDRFGIERYTIEGINYLAQQAMGAFGYIIISGASFTTGAVINNPNELLLNIEDGEYYKWTGSFAAGSKVVQANSTPQTSGGVGTGLWLGVGDGSLRSQLYSPLVGNGDELLRVVQPFSGAMLRTQHEKNQDYVTFEDFGAVGNGIVDDTSALQAAIDSGSAFIRSSPSLKKRVYKISSAIIVKRQVSLDFCFSEVKQTINKSHFLVGFIDEQVNSPKFYNLTMINTIPTTEEQIQFKNVGMLIMDNCRAYGDGKALGLAKLINCIVSTIRGCIVSGCTSKDIRLEGLGGGALRTVDTTIYDCRLEGSPTAISVGDYVEGLFIRRNIMYAHTIVTIEIDQTTEGRMLSGKIQDNDFDSPGVSVFLYVSNFNNLQVTGNWFAGGISTRNIVIESGCDSTLISDNQAYPKEAFIVDDGKGTIISSNMISGGTVPIQFGINSNFTSVTSNSIRNCISACIDITNHIGKLHIASNFLSSLGNIGISGSEKTGMVIEGNSGDQLRGNTTAAYIGAISPRTWTVGARSENILLIGGSITSVVVNGTKVWPLSGSTYNQGCFSIGVLPPGSTFSVDFDTSSVPWLTRIKQ